MIWMNPFLVIPGFAGRFPYEAKLAMTRQDNPHFSE